VPFHRGHQLVGKLVLESVKAGKKPADWSGEALAGFAPEFTIDMARLLKPVEGMKTRTVPGGTAPEVVNQALAEAATRLSSMKQRLA
jgi:argininosuccinate lyase